VRHFVLENSDLKDRRIQPETFGRYAGHPVTCISLDGPPNWDKVAQGERLSFGEYYDRHMDIIAALNHRHPWGLLPLSKMVNTTQMVLERFTTIFPIKRSPFRLRWQPERYFDAVLRYGYDSDETLARSSRNLLGGAQFFVLPALHKNKGDFWDLRALRGSILMLDNTENARLFWARALNIPIDRVINYPKDDAHLLFYNAHDLRHLRHLWSRSRSDLMSYHCEVDAEFFARRSLRQKGVGTETLEAARHYRYFRLLSQSHIYWIAPSVDCLEVGKAPLEFTEVYKAVNEIHARLGMFFGGIPQKNIASTELQHAIASQQFSLAKPCENKRLINTLGQAQEIYDSECRPLLRSQPERVLSALRELLENGSFDRNSLSRRIAREILKAANYFNPELTCSPTSRVTPRLPIGFASRGINPAAPTR
jgi:hypothetical protein